MTSARLEAVTQILRDRLAGVTALAARFTLAFPGEGVISIDGHATPPIISNQDVQADCTLTMALETFERILAGEMDETTAFLQGEMKITGDVSAATRLNDALRVGRS